jgi:hypothetical protein
VCACFPPGPPKSTPLTTCIIRARIFQPFRSSYFLINRLSAQGPVPPERVATISARCSVSDKLKARRLNRIIAKHSRLAKSRHWRSAPAPVPSTTPSAACHPQYMTKTLFLQRFYVYILSHIIEADYMICMVTLSIRRWKAEAGTADRCLWWSCRRSRRRRAGSLRRRWPLTRGGGKRAPRSEPRKTEIGTAERVRDVSSLSSTAPSLPSHSTIA